MEWMTGRITQIFPQDASGDLKLCPVTSKMCGICSFLCIGIALCVHLTCDYADTQPAIARSQDGQLSACHQLAATMSLVGLLYELAIKGSIHLLGLKSAYQDDLVLRNRLRLNTKMIVVLAVLTSVYHAMVYDVQWVHVGWLAEKCGGAQAVYSVRYIEWVLCSPLVFSIIGQLPYSPDGSPRNGLIPSGVLTGAYCLVAWQGIVVKNVFAAWLCIVWAFVCYAVASAEQLHFAWYLKDQGRAGPLRAGLLFYIVTVCGIYGIVYLLPIAGFVSPAFENKFYCLADLSFKLGTSVMCIATYDIAANEHMRRRAEATAQDLHRMIDTASVPIFGVDGAGKVSQWNQKAHAITGLSPEDAMGKSLVDMLGDGQQGEAQELIRRTLAGECSNYVETTMTTQSADGEKGAQPAALVLSASARRDTTGGITGVTLVGCDMTEVQAFKEAEVRKTRFMAVVSHELRSPLHGIIGLVEHLETQETDMEKARWLNMIRNCAGRLLDLVVNIMEMAALAQKDASGKPKTLKLQRDPVELHKVIDEVVTLVRNSVDKSGNMLLKKGVELRNKVGRLPIIEGDAHRCTQVFYNMVTNACKFTSKGSITISSRMDPLGRWVEVVLRDTGIGIPASSHARIFQPFEQEDSSDVRHYQGVGLGLSISQEVVRLHGGRIHLESEVGAGTTFTVRLPVVLGNNVADMEEDDRSEAVPRTLSDVGGLEPEVTRQDTYRQKPLVLSVDNDQVNQMVVETILSSEYELHTAMDGPAALEYLESCDAKDLPDCVLLDTMTSGASGFEVCRNIRQKMNLDPATLPVIMLSNSSSPSEQSQSFDSGCNSYVTKPFSKAKLQSHVAAVLDDRKSRSSHKS